MGLFLGLAVTLGVVGVDGVSRETQRQTLNNSIKVGKGTSSWSCGVGHVGGVLGGQNGAHGNDSLLRDVNGHGFGGPGA